MGGCSIFPHPYSTLFHQHGLSPQPPTHMLLFISIATTEVQATTSSHPTTLAACLLLRLFCILSPSHPPALCRSWGAAGIIQIHSQTSPPSWVYCCHEEPKYPYVPHGLPQSGPTNMNHPTEALSLTRCALAPQVLSGLLEPEISSPRAFVFPSARNTSQPCSVQALN